MRRIITVVLTIVICASLFSISAQAANRGVEYKSSVTEVNPGDDVIVTMGFDDYDNVSAFYTDVVFEASEIQLAKKPQLSISSMIFDCDNNAIICGFSNAIHLNEDAVVFNFKVSEAAKSGSQIIITFKTSVSRKGEPQNDSIADKRVVLNVKAAPCKHSIIKKETIPATCAENGVIEHYTCTKCGVNFSDEAATKEITNLAILKNPDNHTGETEIRNAKSATEDAKGYTGDTYCLGCGKLIKSGEDIPILNHTHAMEHVTAIPATCTEDGTVEHYHCSKCGKNYANEAGTAELETVAALALGHKTEIKNAKPATCTEAGYTGDEICTVCGKTIKKGQETKPTGHTEETVAGKEATCTEGGLTEGKKCSMCQAIIVAQKTTEALGHDYEKTVVSPTCTEPGYTESSCSRCHDSFRTDETPAKGHTEMEVEEIPATCTEDGQKAGKKCSECGEIIEGLERVPALGHTLEIRNRVEPTESKNGYTGDTYCTACGNLISKGSIIYTQNKCELLGYIMLNDTYHIVYFTNNTACTAPHVYGLDGKCLCGAIRKQDEVNIPNAEETIVIGDPIESNTADEEQENNSNANEALVSNDMDSNPKTGIVLSLLPALIAAIAVFTERR